MSATRVTIVGTGYIARFHARAIKRLKGVELVGVCDANPISAQSFAADWGVPVAFDFLESMLRNQRVDVVHVLVPPTNTVKSPTAALRSGAHAF